MISQVAGTLTRKDLDSVEVHTSSGVAYELAVPLGTFESLPRVGEPVTLHTHLVVREDEWQIFGFASVRERWVFRRLLGAKGVGPALALGMLSTLSADRVVRAIRERDVATLQRVPRVGRKKAEQMILDLADRLPDPDDEAADPVRAGGTAADDATRALVSLGFGGPDAEKAVRRVLEASEKKADAPSIIRAALNLLAHRPAHPTR